ncbi:MAG: arginine N-succinyltransferase [Maricaulaceae bacterium]
MATPTQLTSTHSQATYFIRPVCQADAQGLLELILRSSGGLSSLQPRLDFLKDYIASSEASFAGTKPVEAPHKYLLVMIDPSNDRLIGCTAVKTQIGKESPFINFDLYGDGENQVLRASSRFLGATEVGSLFLHPDYRASGLGRYLAKVRYLLMASEPWRFGETVIAELRGICGEDGSPLYDHLFEYKLDQTFLEADAEYFDRNPDALGDIVPLGDISVPDLPTDVVASLAQPHPSGEAARRLLQNEGFIFSGTIDLFDGGPIMAAHSRTIRTILNAKTGSALPDDSALEGHTTLMCQGDVAGFKAVVTCGRETAAGLSVPSLAAGFMAAGDIRYWQDMRRTVKAAELQNTAADTAPTEFRASA